MAFAIVANSVKVNSRQASSDQSLRNIYDAELEVSFTAANTDTALTLATVASGDATNGPDITTLLGKMEKVEAYNFLESPRAAAAAGAAHTYNGSKTNPVWTFAGGGTTPTALTLWLKVKLAKDMGPVISANQ